MSNVSSLRPPKYRLHKAKRLAVVTIRGRDIYLGKYGSASSKSEYRRLVAEYLQSGGQGPHAGRQDVTVAEVMLAYLRFAKEYYRKHGKPTREFEMIRDCCRIIKPLYGRTPAIQFGPLRLKTVRQAMIEVDHSRKYINKNVERVRRMFKWAAAEEMIPASVHQALSMVTGLRRGRTEARETTPILPVDDTVIEQTLERLPAIVADMVRLERLTGMRPAEVCMVRPKDIDQSDEVWIYQPESHKTEHHGRDRVIPIGPKAQEILLRYLARDTSMYCFRPCDSEAKRRADVHANRKTPASCGNRPGSNRKRNPKRSAGECYSTGSYRRAIHRACDKAFPHPTLGYKLRSCFTDAEKKELREWQSGHHWSPNQLRHTAATEIRQKFGLEAAQIILGHSSADVTQVYAERDLAKGMEVALKIG